MLFQIEFNDFLACNITDNHRISKHLLSKYHYYGYALFAFRYGRSYVLLLVSFNGIISLVHVGVSSAYNET